MAKLETNIKFVHDLLNNDGISNEERKQILSLFSKYIYEFENQVVNKLSELAVDPKNFSKKSLKITDKNILIHKPLRTLDLLKLFTNNDLFKYTTHSWDRKRDGTEVVDREKFPFDLKEAFNKEKFIELTENGLIDLYWTISNYLFFDYEKSNPIASIGWAKTYHDRLSMGFKYGWGCQGFIEYYTQSQSNFMDYEIAKKYRPVLYTKKFMNDYFENKEGKEKKVFPNDEDIEEVLAVDELSFRYFEDFVTIFKKQIEFRGNDLYSFIISEFNRQNRFDGKLTVEGIKGLDIYTDTARIKLALGKIASNTVTREKGKELKIISKFSDDNTYVILDIHHVGSFSNAHLNSNSKLTFKEKAGDLWNIREYLVSLCDFSIISIFKDNDGLEKPMEIIYLSKDRQIIESKEDQFTIVELSEKPIGFTYRLKFYL